MIVCYRNVNNGAVMFTNLLACMHVTAITMKAPDCPMIYIRNYPYWTCWTIVTYLFVKLTMMTAAVNTFLTHANHIFTSTCYLSEV